LRAKPPAKLPVAEHKAAFSILLHKTAASMLFYFRFANPAIVLAKTGREMQQAIRDPDPGAHSNLVKKLERVRSIIDGRFVAACEFLPRSLGGIRSLTASLDRLAEAFDSEIAAATQAELTLAAAKLCSLPASQAKQADTVDRLSRSIRTLGRHIAAIRKSFAPVNGIARDTGFEETNAAIGGIDGTIYDQIAQSGADLQAFQDELRLLKRELGLAIVQGEIRNRKMAALIPAIPDELAATTRQLSACYKNIAATAETVAAVVDDIRRRLDHLLTSLQIGDITRQRLEHMLSCIAAIEAGTKIRPEGQRRRFRATCYALIAQHLAEIDDDFARQTDVIEDQLAAMASESAQLLKLHAIAFDRNSNGETGFLHATAARLDTVVGLVAPIEEADVNALATERAMIETAHHLDGHIDRIRTLRRSLTATGMEDRALGATMHIGLTAIDRLTELTDTIAIVASDARILDSKVLSTANALASAAERVHKARDITESDLGDVAAEGEAVVGILTVSASRLCLRLEIGEILALSALEAADLAAAAYDPAESLPEPLVRTLTSLSCFYTMARERDLHRSFLEARSIAGTDHRPQFPADIPDSLLF
jgi:hypothetical protein